MLRKIFAFLIALTLTAASALASNTNDGCPAPTETNISTSLRLTALYPNPNTGEQEWVEIENTDSETLILANYSLEDSTAKPWTLSGNLEAGETAQISGFPFQLNNSNETVTLKTVNGETVDTWTYASSEKGVVLYREAANEEVVETTETPSSTPALLPIFSEALPNPEGSDGSDEWIELYNPHGEIITLSGLKLDDNEGGSTPYALSGTLAAESYLLLSVTETSLTLNNDSDHLRLLGVNNEILWDIPYEGPEEAWSYALFGESYAWTSTPTPGEENSLDLPITESEESESKSKESNYADGDLSEDVAITEIFPNPEGPDNEEEWIELTNGGGVDVNLGNWTLTDASGKTYVFPDTTVIHAGETLVLYRPETEISLNNSNESVTLADPTGEVTSEVSFESSEEDAAYAEITIEEVSSQQASVSGLGNMALTLWQWVTPSPGLQNPVWKQIKGTVTDFDGSLLTLFDGLSTWTFTTDGNTSNVLLYETGNSLLVQAALQNELYKVMHAELLESGTAPGDTKKFPWNTLLSLTALSTWAGYELYKHRKSILNFRLQALN